MHALGEIKDRRERESERGGELFLLNKRESEKERKES